MKTRSYEQEENHFLGNYCSDSCGNCALCAFRQSLGHFGQCYCIRSRGCNRMDSEGYLHQVFYQEIVC